MFLTLVGDRNCGELVVKGSYENGFIKLSCVCGKVFPYPEKHFKTLNKLDCGCGKGVTNLVYSYKNYERNRSGIISTDAYVASKDDVVINQLALKKSPIRIIRMFQRPERFYGFNGSFVKFWEAIQPIPESHDYILTTIDKTKPYGPGNIDWVERRYAFPYMFILNGYPFAKFTLKDALDIVGISFWTYDRRVKLGESTQLAATHKVVRVSNAWKPEYGYTTFNPTDNPVSIRSKFLTQIRNSKLENNSTNI